MCSPALQGLLGVLDEEPAASDAATQLQRGFAYQAVGQLAGRLPALFAGRTDIATRFFEALGQVPPYTAL